MAGNARLAALLALALLLPTVAPQPAGDAAALTGGADIMSLDPAAEPAAMAAAVATVDPAVDMPWEAQTAAWDAQARQFADAAQNKPAFIFFGDSITGFGDLPDGWTKSLRGTYGSSVDMFNMGRGMGNTRGLYDYLQVAAMTYFDEDFHKPNRPTRWSNAKLATICLGANDAATNRKNLTLRFVPVAEYKRRYDVGIAFLRQRNVSNIVLITPPISSVLRLDRNIQVTGEYAQATRALAAKWKLPVADLYDAMVKQQAWDPKYFVADGLHLNAAGNKIMYNTLLQTIRTALPSIAPGVLGKRAALVGA